MRISDWSSDVCSSDLVQPLQRRHRLAHGVFLVVVEAVAPDVEGELFAQRVDHRDANAVQAAGNLVAVVVELTAGVQLGHDDLRRRDALFLVDVDRMPRPLSDTDTEPSSWMVTVTLSAWPARASSIELSTTSNTMWCRPVPSWTSPMYMPGRLRTASRPRSTVIRLES